MFIDSHCHLDFPELKPNFPQILENMANSKVIGALCISVELEKFPDILAMVEAKDNLWASVGIHPNHHDHPEVTVAQLAKLAQHPKVLAIGETGLDYFRFEGDRAWQQNLFRTQIRAARESGRPLVIHSRKAEADTLAILESEKSHEICGVIHCFSGSYDFAMKAVEVLGFAISFSGILTFKKADELREIARKIPKKHLLIETDSPYLAPEPYRGKVNEPAWVVHTAEALAKAKNTTSEEISQWTTENFVRLFKAQLPVAVA